MSECEGLMKPDRPLRNWRCYLCCSGFVMKELSSGEADIFFVDFGNVERCHPSCLRSSPDDLWQNRPIALPFKVHGRGNSFLSWSHLPQVHVRSAGTVQDLAITAGSPRLARSGSRRRRVWLRSQYQSHSVWNVTETFLVPFCLHSPCFRNWVSVLITVRDKRRATPVWKEKLKRPPFWLASCSLPGWPTNSTTLQMMGFHSKESGASVEWLNAFHSLRGFVRLPQ